MIKVSVIMPSLNVAEYIEECLVSALNQTLKEIEIICIDAGSTDGTWEILQRYADDTRWQSVIRLIRSDIKSYGYQVNFGIRQAQDEYVAILETDDYADICMYDELYKLATANGADFVKADYDRFWTLENGQRCFERVKLWRNIEAYYNKLFCPQQMLYLYANDFNIWKGIYKRSFLLGNDIWLNESAGAAFQDIGFAQMVLACAKRAYYTDKSFYRYRFDREMSSVNSVKGLEYAYQEFSRLIEEKDIFSKVTCIKGLYYHMAQSFVWEYKKVLSVLYFDGDTDKVKSYYEWFRDVLSEGFENNILPVEGMSNGFVLELKKLLYDNSNYIRTQQEAATGKQHLLDKCVGKDVYIFCVGNYGQKVIDFLRDNQIEPVGICDNNRQLWGNKVKDIRVLSPEECIAAMVNGENGMFVIANTLRANEIHNQLVELGINEKCIVRI